MESIARPNYRRGTLLAMPKTLAEKMVAIRHACGFGDDRQAAAFARKIGIKPPSLHDIESGNTLSLGAKTIVGLIRLGVRLRYIETGRGSIMQSKRGIEHQLKVDSLESMIGELDEGETDVVTDVVKSMIRRKKGSSPNDPFKRDPPSGGTQ